MREAEKRGLSVIPWDRGAHTTRALEKIIWKSGNPSETDHENIVNSKELKITGKNIPLSSHLRAVQLTRSLPHGKILRNRPAA